MTLGKLALLFFAVAWVMIAPASMASPVGDSARKGIGLESDVEITLDRGDYQPKPMDDRTPLILRLDKVKPAANGRFTYLFHYISFEPGA